MTETTQTYAYVPQTDRMARVEKLAEWLDNRWKLPGTEFRVGVDGILGLLPGVGDTLSAMLSSYILYEAHNLGAPWHIKARMLWNVIVDWFVGLVPLLGDLLDFGWKANQKNASLLRDHLRKRSSA